MKARNVRIRVVWFRSPSSPETSTAPLNLADHGLQTALCDPRPPLSSSLCSHGVKTKTLCHTYWQQFSISATSKQNTVLCEKLLFLENYWNQIDYIDCIIATHITMKTPHKDPDFRECQFITP